LVAQPRGSVKELKRSEISEILEDLKETKEFYLNEYTTH